MDDDEPRGRERLWLITIGAFLASGVCMFMPVGWTTFHSTGALRFFAWIELGIGVIGLVALWKTRHGRP